MATTREELKAVHDLFLANKPEGASHDSAECPLCKEGGEPTHAPEGGVMSTATAFTKEDFEAAVAAAVDAAVKPLNDEIIALKASDEEEAVKARIAEAVAPFEAQVEELQAKLDTAVLEAQAAKDELTTVTSYLETESARVEAETAAAAVKDERLAKVRDAVNFPEEHLTANADRWATLDEAAFEAMLAEYKLIAPKKEATTTTTTEKIPTSTAMTASAGDAGEKPDGRNLMREVMSMSLHGNDPRTLRGGVK